mgnify:CR=1 FL=1
MVIKSALVGDLSQEWLNYSFYVGQWCNKQRAIQTQNISCFLILSKDFKMIISVA